MKNIMSKVRLASIAVATLTACAGGEVGEGPLDTLAAPAVAAHANMEQTRLAAMSPGKPTAPVGLSISPGTESLPVGQPTGLALRLRTDTPVDGLELTLEAGPGVELLAPTAPLTLGPAPAGGEFEVPVQLVVTGEGPARLAGLMVLESAGQSQARSVSINLPVLGMAAGSNPVAAAAAASKVAPVVDSTGEMVRSMQAETTVRQ